MSDVKRYHVTEAGLVEGEALGRINVVLGPDHDRVTAELKTGIAKHWQVVCDQRAKIDALQQLLNAKDERTDRLEAGLKWETERNALLLASLTDAEDMLSVTSIEAGERIDQLEGLLSRWAELLGVSAPGLRDETLAALKPAEGGGDDA